MKADVPVMRSTCKHPAMVARVKVGFLSKTQIDIGKSLTEFLRPFRVATSDFPYLSTSDVRLARMMAVPVKKVLRFQKKFIL